MRNGCHIRSNNTNKHSPQEQRWGSGFSFVGSNNTNKHSPQERKSLVDMTMICSNNTNKHSPQERNSSRTASISVQIIQINIVLKNSQVY